jgi:hypothetical protein
MVYPSHYWKGSFGYDEPNAHPYEVVREALEDALRRSAAVDGAGRTRPWLQDFSLGQPGYGEAEVRAQIQATYDVGIQEWVLWNPSSRYTLSALEPINGFEREPVMRVAGIVTPVSRRQLVMDSLAALATPRDAAAPTEGDGTGSDERPDDPGSDEVQAEPAPNPVPDSVGVGGVDSDSIPGQPSSRGR